MSDPCDSILTVITRLELRKLEKLVTGSDPNAFVFANIIREASGGTIKRRHHEHERRSKKSKFKIQKKNIGF